MSKRQLELSRFYTKLFTFDFFMNAPRNWSRPLPIPNKDNLISSEAVLKNRKAFVPSYLKDTENMWWVMNMEYMRKWFEERTQEENFMKANKDPINNYTGILKRRFINRRKPHKIVVQPLPTVSLKRFSNVGCKVDTGIKLKSSGHFYRKDKEPNKS